MNHPEIDYQIVMARRRDELAAAEHSRLVKFVLDAQKELRGPGNAFHPGLVIQSALRLAGQGLYQLGLRIEDWGCQLQVRYATPGMGEHSAPCK